MFFFHLKIEEDSKKLDFNWLSIFRPGLLDRGGDNRTVEKVAGTLIMANYLYFVYQASVLFYYFAFAIL